jgi:hypothetical protein
MTHPQLRLSSSGEAPSFAVWSVAGGEHLDFGGQKTLDSSLSALFPASNAVHAVKIGVRSRNTSTPFPLS